MSEYPGAVWAGVSPNKAPREGRVELFIVHHWAGGYGGNREAAARGQRDVFMRPNARRVSPNFQVNADGSIWEIVPPDRYRAWTSGQIDHKAVTVETQNISGEPHWGISRESHEAIAHLVAWAAQRYGFPIQRGEVGKGNRIIKPGVIGHREVPTAATACPGPSMDLDWIVDRARQIAAGKEDDMGTIDNTEENYQTIGRFLQRAIKFDVRENGFGPDWKLGATLWEKLNAADDSADAKEIAASVGAIGSEVAKVNVALAGLATPDLEIDVDTLVAELKEGLAPEILKALGEKLR